MTAIKNVFGIALVATVSILVTALSTGWQNGADFVDTKDSDADGIIDLHDGDDDNDGILDRWDNDDDDDDTPDSEDPDHVKVLPLDQYYAKSPDECNPMGDGSLQSPIKLD